VREVGRLNELAGDLAAITTAKQRADAASVRAAEAAAAARQEAADAKTEAVALNHRLAELQRACTEKDAECGALRGQLRGMATVQAELEAQVTRDIKVRPTLRPCSLFPLSPHTSLLPDAERGDGRGALLARLHARHAGRSGCGGGHVTCGTECAAGGGIALCLAHAIGCGCAACADI